MAEELSKHLESIVSADDVVKKSSTEHKFRDIFISKDVDSIGDYIVWDVVVPAIKGMLSDALHGSIDRVFGRSAKGNYSSRYGYKDRNSRYDYRSRYDRDRDDDRRDRYSNRDSEITFRSRAKAEEVRDTLYEIIDRQRYVTIAHLNDLVGVPYDDRGRDDEDWGWYSISRSRIKSTRDGYTLILPRPERVD